MNKIYFHYRIDLKNYDDNKYYCWFLFAYSSLCLSFARARSFPFDRSFAHLQPLQSILVLLVWAGHAPCCVTPAASAFFICYATSLSLSRYLSLIINSPSVLDKLFLFWLATWSERDILLMSIAIRLCHCDSRFVRFEHKLFVLPRLEIDVFINWDREMHHTSSSSSSPCSPHTRPVYKFYISFSSFFAFLLSSNMHAMHCVYTIYSDKIVM